MRKELRISSRGDACESDRFRETRKYMQIGVCESDKVPLKFLLVSMKVSRNKKVFESVKLYFKFFFYMN